MLVLCVIFVISCHRKLTAVEILLDKVIIICRHHLDTVGVYRRHELQRWRTQSGRGPRARALSVEGASAFRLVDNT